MKMEKTFKKGSWESPSIMLVQPTLSIPPRIPHRLIAKSLEEAFPFSEIDVPQSVSCIEMRTFGFFHVEDNRKVDWPKIIEKLKGHVGPSL